MPAHNATRTPVPDGSSMDQFRGVPLAGGAEAGRVPCDTCASTREFGAPCTFCTHRMRRQDRVLYDVRLKLVRTVEGIERLSDGRRATLRACGLGDLLDDLGEALGLLGFSVGAFPPPD